MARRKPRSSSDHSGASYQVGYCKPPRNTQFPPGQSGNPAGRRKGIRNFETDVIRTLSTPVKVKENGRTRTKSTQEGALMVMREKALRGDARALNSLLELAMRYNGAAEIPINQPLDTDDRAILDAYADELARTVTCEPTKAPTNTESPPTRPPHSGKKEQQ